MKDVFDERTKEMHPLSPFFFRAVIIIVLIMPIFIAMRAYSEFVELGHTGMAVPAAIITGILLSVFSWILVYLLNKKCKNIFIKKV